MNQARPVLYVIACGGRPAGDLPDFITNLQADGWTVCVIATPSGMKFIDTELLQEITGYPVRSDYKGPEEPDVLPPADVILIAPATFNTTNKIAGGISDTLALGLVNEAIGLGLPIIAVPWPNVALAKHPAFARSVNDLRGWGINLIFDPDNLPAPNSGAAGKVTFPWTDIREALRSAKVNL